MSVPKSSLEEEVAVRVVLIESRLHALIALTGLTLVERVEKLVEGSKAPLLATTPTSLAVQELIARTEALENAVREIALEVQKLSTQG